MHAVIAAVVTKRDCGNMLSELARRGIVLNLRTAGNCLIFFFREYGEATIVTRGGLVRYRCSPGLADERDEHNRDSSESQLIKIRSSLHQCDPTVVPTGSCRQRGRLIVP